MKPQTRLSTAAIGFHRDDGDFQLLATLNNNDEWIAPDQFTEIVQFFRDQLQAALSAQGEHTLAVLERQDAPDYVTLDEDDAHAILSAKRSIPTPHDSHEPLRKAAQAMLAALTACVHFMADDLDESDQTESRIFYQAQAAIDQANAVMPEQEPL